MLSGLAVTVDRALREHAKLAEKCAFCECDIAIDPQYDLCIRHNRARQRGTIDKCPRCWRFKGKRYQLCSFCNSAKAAGEPVAPEKVSKGGRDQRRYQLESSPVWEAGDADARSFHVYVLKLEGGEFYAGQTRELRERLSEHRDGRTQSTAGRKPKLVWFTEVSSRKDAAELEVELKKAIDRNPRIIRRLITDFHDLVRELDFD